MQQCRVRLQRSGSGGFLCCESVLSITETSVRRYLLQHRFARPCAPPVRIDMLGKPRSSALERCVIKIDRPAAPYRVSAVAQFFQPLLDLERRTHRTQPPTGSVAALDQFGKRGRAAGIAVMKDLDQGIHIRQSSPAGAI